MANLYDIDERLETIVNEGFDVEDGEILEDEELNKRFNEVTMELDKKITNIACYIKNLKSDVEEFKKEKKTIEARQKTAEKKLAFLEKYLDSYIRWTTKDISKYKFENSKCRISYRKSQKCVITDPELVPTYYFIKKEPEISIANIKRDLKNDIDVYGAELVECENLVIK